MSGNALEQLPIEDQGFASLGLPENLLTILAKVGYHTPSAIQAQSIPHLLNGEDLLGQAQTGTGKTAAFALPLIARLDLEADHTQVLVLTPTRELAIQVAEAFQKYAAHVPGFKVVPIYGGQSYDTQLKQLKRRPMVVVGTPGRVMDHIRRKTLHLEQISSFVLDEADEMLKMGFLEDVEWILERTPAERQIALFSATMPEAVRRIARKYLQEPHEVTVKTQTTTAKAINQRFCAVAGYQKLDALTRVLEVEDFDAVLIFVRTKNATLELDEKLKAKGFACAPLNGDIAQSHREKTVEQLKQGKLDILIATDVAARGLDIDRVSHVINYDIPHDTEAYVHRIGRTGRAGRSGEAILFVAPREKRMLQSIERATRQPIEQMPLPTAEQINRKRISQFKSRITATLLKNSWKQFVDIIEEYVGEEKRSPIEVAAALASLAQGGQPLAMPADADRGLVSRDLKLSTRAPRDTFDRPERAERPSRRGGTAQAEGLASYRIEVGRKHRVKAGNIVGAIANEGGIDSHLIGNIEIFDFHSTVDLPESLSEGVLKRLRQAWIAGQQLEISRAAGGTRSSGASRKPAGKFSGSDERKTREPRSDAPRARTSERGSERRDSRSETPKGKREKPKGGKSYFGSDRKDAGPKKTFKDAKRKTKRSAD